MADWYSRSLAAAAMCGIEYCDGYSILFIAAAFCDSSSEMKWIARGGWLYGAAESDCTTYKTSKKGPAAKIKNIIKSHCEE